MESNNSNSNNRSMVVIEEEEEEEEAEVQVEFQKSCSCSWDVVTGTGSVSVDDVVTCESSFSLSLSDSEDQQSQSQPHPLVLRRPSTDSSSPCQITIVFPEKHEIKQIYVRSSARVFEIYYDHDHDHDLNYLSTVRCGLAQPKSNTSTTSSSASTDDGWVDIFDQTASHLDFFEATAQISDAHPVLSLTIRLLSIQTGDSVYVDEVYVFADPITTCTPSPSDTSSTTTTTTTSALMSMLVPTLFNISNSRFSHLEPNTHSLFNNSSATTATTTQDHAPRKLNTDQSLLPVPIPSPLRSPHTDAQTSRIQKTLDELVTRVARMENFCLRFEDNMLKPLSTMEARLARLELHLESLIKNVPLPKTPCCTSTFSAPEFSSVCTDADGYYARNTKSHSPDDDCCIGCPSDPPLEAPSSPCVFQSDHMPNGSQLLPSLVVTAPDFSSVDDDEQNDIVVAVTNSGLKKPLSIDDALASALAGLLCSASTTSLESTNAIEKDLDYTCTEGTKDNISTGSFPSDTTLAPPAHIDGIHENISSCCIDSVMTEQEICATSDSFEKTTETVVGDDHLLEGKCNNVQEIDNSSVNAVISLGKDSPLKDSIFHNQGSLATDYSREETNEDGQGKSFVNCLEPIGCFDDRVGNAGTSETGDNDVSGGIACQAAHDAPSRIVLSDYSNMPATIDVPAAGAVSSASSQVAGGIGDSSFGVGHAKDTSGVLLNLMQLPMPATVDFEIPILDVKFSPHEISSVISPVEALLMGEQPQLQSEVLCFREANNRSLSESNDFITVDNEEPATSEIPNNPLFSPGNHDCGCTPLNSEVHNQYVHASLI